MMSSDRVRRGLRFAALGAALLLAACANNPAQQAGLGGPGSGGVAAPGTPQEFVVAVGDRIFFPVDQTELTPQAQATLDRQAQWLQRYPRYTALIEGHADERGTREYNLALSARRATVVHAYLVGRGVAPSRLRTISYGKERPVALCDDESCWSQNRRAVTVIDAGRSS